MPTLSVLYVIRNEQDCIKKSIESIQDIADEIVIVDTGSRDKTLHICRQFRKTKILTHAWVHDYSKTKNYGIKNCTSDWILSLDADEMLDSSSAAAVRNAVESAKSNVLGFGLHFVDHEQTWDPYGPHNEKPYFASPQVRLFKRQNNIFFEGRALESVSNSVKKLGAIDVLGAKIHHWLWHGRGAEFGRARVNYYNKLGANLPSVEQAEVEEKELEPSGDQTAIVVVGHNALNYTRECISSVMRNTLSPYSLHLVDNGSGDGTFEYMRGVVGRSPMRFNSNVGVPRAKNFGAREALADPNAKYICFLDNDTTVPPGWLEEMIAVMRKEPKIGIIGPLSMGADGPQFFDAPGAMKNREPEYFFADAIGGFCMLTTTEVARKIGLFDESFGLYGFEDRDFCARAKQAGYEIAIANKVYVHHKGKATLLENNMDWNGLSQYAAARYGMKWASSPLQATGNRSPAKNLPKRTAGQAVSIVILTHNRLDRTSECLLSIQKTTTNYELIIVDNASSDNTVQWIAENFPQAKIIRNTENLGVPKARNQGLKATTCEYIVVMDNDVVVYEGWIEELFDSAKRGADIVGIEGWQLDHLHQACWKCQNADERFDYLGGACTLFRRKVFEEIGLLDEGFSPAYYEDVDICIRAKSRGFKLAWKPTKSIHHKEHSTLIHGQKDFVYSEVLARSHSRFAAKMKGELRVEYERLLPPQKKVKVLYLGMQWDYGIRERGTSFEHDNFYPAMQQWDRIREFEHFDFVEIGRAHGVPRMSEMLYERVQKFEPDAIFGVWFDEHHDPRREMIDKIRKTTPTKVISWFCDSFYRYDTFDRRWADHVDWCVCCSTGGYNKYIRDGLQNKVIKSQFAAAPSYKPVDGVQRDIDVSFVGQPHGDRKAIINRLRQAGINVQAFGTGWEKRLTFGEMIDVFNRSKVNLNLSNGAAGTFQQIKGRNFEVPACRTFLLTGQAENLNDYYEFGKEVAVYHNADDIVEKVRYYLANPDEREQMAEAAYYRTLHEHTYGHRFNHIFKVAGLI